MTMSKMNDRDMVDLATGELVRMFNDYLEEAYHNHGPDYTDRFAHSGDLLGDFFRWADVTLTG